MYFTYTHIYIISEIIKLQEYVAKTVRIFFSGIFLLYKSLW